MDATFKAAKKATVADVTSPGTGGKKEQDFEDLFKGGIISTLNEINEIIDWVSGNIQLDLLTSISPHPGICRDSASLSRRLR